MAKLKDLELIFNQITEITGLETLTNLTRLCLYENQINEITGLENLVQLQELNLGANQFNQIKGLETLTNLSYIDLANRQLLNNEIYEENLLHGYPAAQKCVQYCIKIKNFKSVLSKGDILLEEDDLSVFMKQATIEEINFFIQSPKTHPDNIRLLKNEAMRRTIGLKNGLNIYK
ncbi:MAG: leucine-rich repeat domain-containing protein [Promethearchaeota archaeon]